jgi:hypothetical protein
MRGGKRENAGRPATGRTTKVIRVPENFPEIQEVLDLIDCLKGWQEEAQKHKTSPRWQKARELLNSLNLEN